MKAFSFLVPSRAKLLAAFCVLVAIWGFEFMSDKVTARLAFSLHPLEMDSVLRKTVPDFVNAVAPDMEMLTKVARTGKQIDAALSFILAYFFGCIIVAALRKVERIDKV